MEPNDTLTFRKEIYTEVIKNGTVVASYKQNGHLQFFSMTELTAATFDKITGADKPPISNSPKIL